MKKVVLGVIVVLGLCACNRFRVRHDYGRQMEQVRLPVDTAQRNDIRQDSDSWEDETLTELQEEPERNRKAPANVDEQIERMMMGEDVGDIE